MQAEGRAARWRDSPASLSPVELLLQPVTRGVARAQAAASGSGTAKAEEVLVRGAGGGAPSMWLEQSPGPTPVADGGCP